MTPAEMKQHAELMLRYAESVEQGKPLKLQYRYRNPQLRKGINTWFDMSAPPTFETQLEYREKPNAPRRWRVEVYKVGNEERIATSVACPPSAEIIEVIELPTFFICGHCGVVFAIILADGESELGDRFCPNCASLETHSYEEEE